MIQFFVDNIVSLEEIEGLPSEFISLENCGKYNKELDGYCIAIPKDCKDKIIDMFTIYDPFNVQHITNLFNIQGIDAYNIVYETITNDYGKSITQYLCNKYDSVDAIFDAYGYELEEEVEYTPSPSPQPEDVTKHSNSYLDEMKELNKQAPTREYVEESVTTYEEDEDEEILTDDEVASRDEIIEYINDIRATTDKYPSFVFDNILAMYDKGNKEAATEQIVSLYSEVMC